MNSINTSTIIKEEKKPLHDSEESWENQWS